MTLERLFDAMEIATDPFALCELQGRCTLAMGRQSRATLHYILAGRGEIALDRGMSLPVSRGTLILIPAQARHSLGGLDGPERLPDCRPAELGLERHIARSEDDRTEAGRLLAICSNLSVSLRDTRELVDLIRTPLLEQIETRQPMATTVDRLLAELCAPRLGSRALIRVLLLQAMIEMLRARLIAGDPALAWMPLLVDRRLWGALERMLDDPGRGHRLEALAEAAGLSRSAFAERFAAAYGHGPMTFLRGLRLRHGAALLMQTDLPVKRVAERVGFQSRSAFTRAFAAEIGLPPRAFRRDRPES